MGKLQLQGNGRMGWVKVLLLSPRPKWAVHHCWGAGEDSRFPRVRLLFCPINQEMWIWAFTLQVLFRPHSHLRDAFLALFFFACFGAAPFIRMGLHPLQKLTEDTHALNSGIAPSVLCDGHFFVRFARVLLHWRHASKHATAPRIWGAVKKEWHRKSVERFNTFNCELWAETRNWCISAISRGGGELNWTLIATQLLPLKVKF